MKARIEQIEREFLKIFEEDPASPGIFQPRRERAFKHGDLRSVGVEGADEVPQLDDSPVTREDRP